MDAEMEYFGWEEVLGLLTRLSISGGPCWTYLSPHFSPPRCLIEHE